MLDRIRAHVVAHPIVADLAVMEDILRDSGLDWTALRPPRLTNRPGTGTYRTVRGQNVRRGRAISRADVAHGMLRVIDQPDTVGYTVGIAY
ncbi:NAD(P)-dependent oxidoreductase [Nocardia sp. NPDC052278]|uniref:NAD(P)-dependent oxidoreductase n=1 Tax=unclassified Nocardia TaxID=2637762 RepID=UPI0036AAB86F